MNSFSNRRNFVKASSLITFSALSGNPFAWTANSEDVLVFIGTYTSRDSEGIYIYRMNQKTGALTPVGKAAGVKNPSYLTIHPSRKYLYSVIEISDYNGERTGGLASFTLNPEDGSLKKMNEQPSHGGSPCYVSTDKTGKWAFVANYGGSFAVYPIQQDGSLGEASTVIRHEGYKAGDVQKGSRAHSIMTSPDNRFLLVADLGIDQLVVYEFEAETGKLTPNKGYNAKPGAGPRHFIFHPNGKMVFLIQELNSTITSLAYNPDKGTLSELDMVATLPKDFEKKNSCADIHVSPDGRFVYGSNRGHNSIAVFAVDEQSGKMEFVEHEPTQGEIPRNFALTQDGTFLTVANQDSDNIVVFSRNEKTGKLTPTDHSIQVSMPVCIKFMPM